MWPASIERPNRENEAIAVAFATITSGQEDCSQEQAAICQGGGYALHGGRKDGADVGVDERNMPGNSASQWHRLLRFGLTVYVVAKYEALL